ncbi:hypothetical protein D3C73_697740 [compost metagenome]
MRGAEDFPLGLDAARLHAGRQFARLAQRRIHQVFAVTKRQVQRGGVQRAHFGAGIHALEPLFPQDFPGAGRGFLHHVAMHAATGGVVQHDVATLADALVHVAVDGGVARGLVVGPARVQRHHAGARVVAAVNVLGDFSGLGRQMRVLGLECHAPGRGDGYDDFAFGHGGLRFTSTARSGSRPAW